MCHWILIKYIYLFSFQFNVWSLFLQLNFYQSLFFCVCVFHIFIIHKILISCVAGACYNIYTLHSERTSLNMRMVLLKIQLTAVKSTIASFSYQKCTIKVIEILINLTRNLKFMATWYHKKIKLYLLSEKNLKITDIVVFWSLKNVKTYEEKRLVTFINFDFCCKLRKNNKNLKLFNFSSIENFSMIPKNLVYFLIYSGWQWNEKKKYWKMNKVEKSFNLSLILFFKKPELSPMKL